MSSIWRAINDGCATRDTATFALAWDAKRTCEAEVRSEGLLHITYTTSRFDIDMITKNIPFNSATITFKVKDVSLELSKSGL